MSEDKIGQFEVMDRVSTIQHMMETLLDEHPSLSDEMKAEVESIQDELSMLYQHAADRYFENEWGGGRLIEALQK